MIDAPIADEGFFVTHFFTVRDQEKSKDFYVRILGGKVIKADRLDRDGKTLAVFRPKLPQQAATPPP